jgi:hypothetical protein
MEVCGYQCAVYLCVEARRLQEFPNKEYQVHRHGISGSRTRNIRFPDKEYQVSNRGL